MPSKKPFAERYELLTEIPPEKVGTFLARDLVTGDRVLIHVFDSPELSDGHLANQDQIANDIGQSSQQQAAKSYTYTVTNNAALHSWQRPVGPGDQPSQQAIHTPAKSSVHSSDQEATPAGNRPVYPQQAPEPVPSNPVHATTLSRSAEPGDFTRQFFNLQDREPQTESAQPEPKSTAPMQADKKSSQVSTETRPDKSDSNQAQSFTDFFQGPFDGNRSSPIPVASHDVFTKSPAKGSGEFTGLFGHDKSAEPAETRPRQYTNPFDENAAPSHPSTVDPVARLPYERSSFPDTAPNDEPLSRRREFQTDILSTDYESSRSDVGRAVYNSRLTSGTATGIFDIPTASQPAEQSPLPSGPSEYTQFMHRQQLPSQPKDKKDPEPSDTRQAAASPVKLPPPPPAPQINIPKAPAMPAPPKAPNPQFKDSVKQKRSLLSLILVLVVLLILAILLIVYFLMQRG